VLSHFKKKEEAMPIIIVWTAMIDYNCAHYNPTFQFDSVKNKNGMVDSTDISQVL
jgi:hypothetical protein